ncbi:MAG: polysaccharide deacetylase family protein [Phycisphaerae bacterium]|nr:polysaccharide deacetylase family protein [Phycisphaerae bacterium]NUQ47375.1 polysaccharide deacetylase family protein [Phycisphaerae bacterium]
MPAFPNIVARRKPRSRCAYRPWRDVAARAIATANRGNLRILTYHGVCRDADHGQPWVPSHYVTASALDRQLELLRRAGTIVDLREMTPLLRSGREWREALFAITFDDAPANLLLLAESILSAHRVSAAVFAVTDRLEDGGLLAEDARQAAFGRAARHAADDPTSAEDGIPTEVRESLRCMRWDELDQMARLGHWIGAHTRSHTVLGRAPSDVRRNEIVRSIVALRNRLGRDDVPFAFPRGQPGDFDSSDVQILRELNVPLAFTAIARPNRLQSDPLMLNRNCIGLHHGHLGFAAEMIGLRDRLASVESRATQPP